MMRKVVKTYDYKNKMVDVEIGLDAEIEFIQKHLHDNWLVFATTTSLVKQPVVRLFHPRYWVEISLMTSEEVISTFPSVGIWGGANWAMKRSWFISHWNRGNFSWYGPD